jgi:hypothetical protein
MQSAVQKSVHFPHSFFVMAGIFLFAATAYPKSLDQGAASADKTKPVHAQCIEQSVKSGVAPHR